MGIKKTYRWSAFLSKGDFVAKQQNRTENSITLSVTQEDLDYLADREQRILSDREQYSWEPIKPFIPKPIDIQVESGKPSLPQCPSQYNPAISHTNEEPATSNRLDAMQLLLPFNNLSILSLTDSVIAGPSTMKEGAAMFPEGEEEEQYFPEDDSNPQFLVDGKEIFEEELLPHHFEKEDDLDINDAWILEESVQENNIADLVEILGEEESPSRETYDFHDYYEPEEYDGKIGRQTFHEIQTSGRVSKSMRARQAAMETGQNFGLTSKEILSIAGIYEENGWANARIAIERELDRGATVEEIYLAAEAKRVWQEHNEYGCGCRTYYTLLSWPMALRLVRSFSGNPDPEVIEDFFMRIFEHWRNSHNLMRIFWPFSSYLTYRLGVTKGTLDFMPDWTFEPHPDVRCEMFLPPSSLDINRIDESKFARHLLRIRTNYPEY